MSCLKPSELGEDKLTDISDGKNRRSTESFGRHGSSRVQATGSSRPPQLRRNNMPVSFITGPTGLSKEAKKELVEGTLNALNKAYQMPDDRVYINEVPSENVGHTPLLAVTHGEDWAVQSEPARITIEVIAPPGIPIEDKRTLVRELTEVAGRAYGRTNLRDVLVSIDQHKVEDFASNGLLQTENPDMAAFTASLQRG
jgi:phenylpyruvate tautomerase PptA (4-oxalocrotonate tautomerase family)